MNCFGFNNIYVSKYPPLEDLENLINQKLYHDQIMAEHYYILKHSELNNWKSKSFYEDAFLTASVQQVRYEFKLLAAQLSAGKTTMIFADHDMLEKVSSCLVITLNYLISLSPIPNVAMDDSQPRTSSYETLEFIDDNIQSLNKLLDLQYFLISPYRLEIYANIRTTFKMILQICKHLN